ncbi:MAG TPA: hypothetical protein VNW94_05490 [Streptosporangiaceae bacterium]|nr:hypothetical protein [Streptosporangiaceae bacterium]
MTHRPGILPPATVETSGTAASPTAQTDPHAGSHSDPSPESHQVVGRSDDVPPRPDGTPSLTGESGTKGTPTADFGYASSDDLLNDLIESVRVPDVREVTPDRTLGVDVFGLLNPPDTPDFLLDPATGRPFDYAGLGPDYGVHYLYLMNMLEATPEPGAMDPATWDIEEGAYSHQGAHHRVPLLVSAIWQGDPLSDTGPSAGFWERFGSAAKQFRGQALYVMFTDVPRADIEAALALTEWSEDPQLLAVQRMAAWAQDAGISLVNIGEVFNSVRPMGLQAEFLTEIAKQTGPGWAFASDHLRWEIADHFGGLYSDGDNTITSLEDFRTVADSRVGFAVHREGSRVFNSAVLIVPGHPVIGEIRGFIHAQYGKTQQDLYSSAGTLRDFWWKTEEGRARRHSGLLRTFPTSVLDVLMQYGGFDRETDLPRLHGVSVGTDGSWKEAFTPPPRPGMGRPRTLAFTQRVVHSLVRDLYNRNGDLRLTGAADAIARHPQPKMVWEAVLRFLASRADLQDLVRGVTMRRLLGADEEFVVELPESVRGLVRYLAGEQPPLGASEGDDAGEFWFGEEHGGGWWLGEQSVAARLEPYEPHRESLAGPSPGRVGWPAPPGPWEESNPQDAESAFGDMREPADDLATRMPSIEAILAGEFGRDVNTTGRTSIASTADEAGSLLGDIEPYTEADAGPGGIPGVDRATREGWAAEKAAPPVVGLPADAALYQAVRDHLPDGIPVPGADGLEGLNETEAGRRPHHDDGPTAASWDGIGWQKSSFSVPDENGVTACVEVTVVRHASRTSG